MPPGRDVVMKRIPVSLHPKMDFLLSRQVVRATARAAAFTSCSQHDSQYARLQPVNKGSHCYHLFSWQELDCLDRPPAQVRSRKDDKRNS
jgi:hypothetical protein